MNLSKRQQKAVNDILSRKRLRGNGRIDILTKNTKFCVGDVAVIVMNSWGEYLENPIKALILEVYSHTESSYGDRPELYIVETENGKIDSGLSPSMLLRKENVYGY